MTPEEIEKKLIKNGFFYIHLSTPRRSKAILLENMSELIKSKAMIFVGEKLGAYQYKYQSPKQIEKIEKKAKKKANKLEKMTPQALLSELMSSGSLTLEKDQITTPLNQKEKTLLLDMTELGILKKSKNKGATIFEVAMKGLTNPNAVEIMGNSSLSNITSDLRVAYRHLNNYLSKDELVTVLQSTVAGHLGEAPEKSSVMDMITKGNVSAEQLIIDMINSIEHQAPKSNLTASMYFQGEIPLKAIPFLKDPTLDGLPIPKSSVKAYAIDKKKIKSIPKQPTNKWIKKINDTSLSADNLLALSSSDAFKVLSSESVQKELLARNEHGYAFGEKEEAIMVFSMDDIKQANLVPGVIEDYALNYEKIKDVMNRNQFTVDLETNQQVLKFSNDLSKAGIKTGLTNESQWCVFNYGGPELMTSMVSLKSPEVLEQDLRLETPSSLPLELTRKIKR